MDRQKLLEHTHAKFIIRSLEDELDFYQSIFYDEEIAYLLEYRDLIQEIKEREKARYYMLKHGYIW